MRLSSGLRLQPVAVYGLRDMFSVEVPGKHPVGRKAYSNIDAASAQKLLDLLERYFSDEYLIPMATDVGSWELHLHSETVNVYRGSLCEDLVIGNIPLSCYMRSIIPIEGLFAFDGISDCVEKEE